VLREPSELLLEEGIQFAACVTDKNIGTAGPNDEFQCYWEAMCQALGMKVEDLPLVPTCRENLPIRLYSTVRVRLIGHQPTLAKSIPIPAIACSKPASRSPGLHLLSRSRRVSGLCLFKSACHGSR